MTPQAARDAGHPQITDLFTLTLVDGLPTTSDGRELRYRVVRLRETNVADERAAQRMAERVVMVKGEPRLLTSEADFRLAMTMRHIDGLSCDGQTLSGALLDLDLMGRLSSHDLGLIEQRVFLITLAAEVRYGNLSTADFERIAAGRSDAGEGSSPQREGQAAGVGQASDRPEPGPALLADFLGATAPSPAPGDGG